MGFSSALSIFKYISIIFKFNFVSHPNNKPLQDRLKVVEKYNNLIDGDYLEDLKDEDVKNFKSIHITL
jgi:hypothetical protein